MRLILSLLLILAAQAFLSCEIKAQSQTAACPSVSVEAKARNPRWAAIQDSIACPGAPLTFTSVVYGIASSERPEFRWTISAGEIVSGQGTSTITISTEKVNVGEVTAKVEVLGVSEFKSECNRTASASIGVAVCCLPPCPTLSINCPTSFPEPGKPVDLSVSISGGDPDAEPKYNWTVSAGKIISGQGTSEISIDTSESEQNITATVQVEGFPPECQKSVSCTISILIYDPPPPSLKFDEYGDVSWINEGRRLNNFAIQLRQQPGASGYVIIYGTRNPAQHLARVRKFLVEKGGIDPGRIGLVNGGYNEKLKVELWIVPTGAEPPKPDPNY